MSDVRKTFTLKHANSFKETIVAAMQRKQLSSQFNAIDGLSLEVPEGQSIALLGRNGSGKSTTLKLLSGVMRPDAGWIRTRGRVAGLLEVGAGFNPNLTGRDNVYLNAAILGMSKAETDARFDDILEFSEIGDFIDTEVKHYSSGMYSRLGFSVAVHTELDVLLVDEILSVGDAAFRAKCAERMQLMRKEGKTMFVVSHSASQVKQLCERGVVLEHGKIVFDGPIHEAVAAMSANPKPATKQKARSKSAKPEFSPHASFGAFVAEHPGKYGTPLSDPTPVEENGGGLVQMRSKGIITTSFALKHTYGLRSGAFLRAYEAAGGPSGPWGFLAGHSTVPADGGPRTLRFQHGVASFHGDEEVAFAPTDDTEDTAGPLPAA
ncbi:ABC transporter ATP-binding protein [Leucobacter luti]|nr:ABC transporter ATP-binding protein [Leucobacter luti]